MNMPQESLTALQIFHGLDQEDAATVCASLKTQTFTPDETILNEGESVQSLWIILSGECIVSRSCGESHDHALAVLTAGDVFGEMSFLRAAPHSASIKAATDVTVCVYHHEDYIKLAASRPAAAGEIVANIAAVLAERLRRMDTWVCDLFNGPAGDDHRDEWKSFRSAVYTNWDF
jgi:CRP/FNR family cyclic AMP-dependent transcriptional regulator